MNKELKIQIENARRELKNKRISVVVVGTGFKMPLNTYLKQEFWRRS